MKAGAMWVVGVLGLAALMPACRDRVPTITLSGDVSCPVPPPTVTGTATLGSGATTITATATITCNGIPVQGVVLTGEIRAPVRTLTFNFPPTDANGTTTLTENLPGAIAVSVGDQFQIRVLDGSGNPVAPPDPVAVAIQ